jgi:hypothetical protein
MLLGLLTSLHGQPLIRKFDASPRSITAGGKIKLIWEVENAKDVSIDPGIGSVRKKGSMLVSPVHDTTYIITARGSSGAPSQSRVTVTVAPNPDSTNDPRKMGLGRVTGRHLLPTGSSEAPGFGLYSYLLFGEKENARNRNRYVAVLRQVLVEISNLEQILGNKPDLRQVNVLYIPVRSAVEVNENSPAEAAELILKNYDFARSQLLLASIDDRYQKGPYFVSRLGPIQQGKEVSRPYLFQDMTQAAPSLALDWVRQFLSQTAKGEPWSASRVESFAFSFRNQIQVLATWVFWKQ